MKQRRIIINGERLAIFWENGGYVAIANDGQGTRRNYAPYNCKTKIEAEIAMRQTFDTPLTQRQEQWVMENGLP